MKKTITAFDLCNLTLLSVLAFVCVYPMLNMLAQSLSSGFAVMAGRVFLLPVGLNLDAYRLILVEEGLGVTRGLWNSIIYTFFGASLAVGATYLSAYCLSRKRFIGRHVMLALIVFTMIFGSGLIPTYLVLNALGFVNNRLVMIVPAAISQWLLIITKSFLDSLPDELEESAFMDGANDFRIMHNIYLPLSTPIVATIGVFYAVAIWNSYLTPLIYLRDLDLHPIQVVLHRLVIDTRGDAGHDLSTVIVDGSVVYPRNLQAAVVFVALFPIMMVYPFAQRYFTKGIMLGAIKG